MEQTHTDFFGKVKEIGESSVLYEQVNINKTSGILAVRNIYEAPEYLYRFQRHCQNVIEILYPQTNQISMWLEGKEYLIQPKDVFIINPGTVHSPGSPVGVTHIDTYIILVDPKALTLPDRNITFQEDIIRQGLVQKSLDLVIDSYNNGNEM